jgi:hypothetical protein
VPAFTVVKSRGAYRLTDAEGNDRATLRARWDMRGGEISTPEGRFGVLADRSHRRVAAGPQNAPLVVLDSSGARVAGLSTPARWELSCGNRRGSRAVLSADGRHVEVIQSARPGARVRIDVDGTWPHFELVLLTAAFAAMSLRRARNLRTLAIAAIVRPR